LLRAEIEARGTERQVGGISAIHIGPGAPKELQMEEGPSRLAPGGRRGEVFAGPGSARTFPPTDRRRGEA